MEPADRQRTPTPDASSRADGPQDATVEATDALPFDAAQIREVNHAVSLAEEIVSNAYKMSATQWLRRRYDVKTLVDLSDAEIVSGPFAQVIRYEGQKSDTSLGSAAYDFYKICLQDHTIRDTLDKHPDLNLMPFVLYIVTHELIHIVRFSQFLQSFQATPAEMMAEEHRVHRQTRELLENIRVAGMDAVLGFFVRWHEPIDGMQ